MQSRKIRILFPSPKEVHQACCFSPQQKIRLLLVADHISTIQIICTKIPDSQKESKFYYRLYCTKSLSTMTHPYQLRNRSSARFPDIAMGHSCKEALLKAYYVTSSAQGTLEIGISYNDVLNTLLHLLYTLILPCPIFSHCTYYL